MYHSQSTYQSRPYGTSHSTYSPLGNVVVTTPQSAVAFATTSPLSAAAGTTAYVSNYDHLYGGTTFHQASDASFYSGAAYQTYQTASKPGGSNYAMEAALQSAALGALQSKAGTFKSSYNRFNTESSSTRSTSFNKPTFSPRPKVDVAYEKRMNPSAIRHRAGESIFYCDICRISCASQMTFKEHQDGQKHKKKELQLAETKPTNKSKSVAASNPAAQQYLCELCNVTCTGTDAYQAHIKGKSHNKTARLHQKMGKPIPECKPIPAVKPLTNEKSSSVTTGNKTAATSSLVHAEAVAEISGQTVGLDYVVEELNSAGKLVNYYCQLCDCRFNDAIARDMHSKGRRHRLQYKKKVDPSLEIDFKSLPGKERRVLQQLSEKLRKQKELSLQRMALQQLGPRPLLPGPVFTRRENRAYGVVDQYVMQKHGEIIITEEEVKEATDILLVCENALRRLSEELDVDGKIVVCKTEPTAVESEESTASKEQETTTKTEGLEQTKRTMRGISRVGLFPKQLLLSGDQTLELVVLLAHKPTKSLVSTVVQRLRSHLQELPESYKVTLDTVSHSRITVTRCDKSAMSCNIYLTAMEVRQSSEDEAMKPSDLVPIEPCLAALALQRQIKWFQMKVSVNPRCLIIIRILRDLCARVDTWSHLNQWVIEVLVERAVTSLMAPLSPGGALRRVFECLASGILLPGGPGLHDPCEKGNIDATSYLTAQQKEDITASAQHALRLIAFGFVYKVLDMEPLPEPAIDDTRKRRFSETEAVGEDENAAETEEGPKKLALEEKEVNAKGT